MEPFFDGLSLRLYALVPKGKDQEAKYIQTKQFSSLLLITSRHLIRSLAQSQTATETKP